MLGTTVNRSGVREDVNNRDYSYSPERPVPSFDARLSRAQQNVYDRYASADVVMQRPAAPTGQEPRPMYNQAPQQQTYGRQDYGRQDYGREPTSDELWNRLTANNVNRSSIEANMNFTPGQPAPFEPIKLREAQPRQYSKTRTSKKLSTQGKVILAVYLAVVLLIVTLVIVNAELINTPAADADPGAAVTNVYEVNEKGLSFVSSPYNSSAEQTNWFDKVCDKLGD